MTLEIGLLFGLLGAMAVLFLTEKLPIEITAFLGLLILVIGGYLSPVEAFSGFSSPAVITMLSVFFLSAALLHTGVADMIGGRVHRLIGNREVLLVIAIMLVAGVLSAFMNNIAAVAVLLPAVASIARKTGVAPSRLFMPLAFGGILGGTMTLVGTPPNILAADLLRERGLEPFSFFDFTPLGIILLGTGILYMITLGRWLLPRRPTAADGAGSEDLAGVYQLRESLFSIRIPRASSLVGVSLGESRLGSALDIQVVGIVHGGKTQLAPRPDTILRGDDLLLVEGKFAHVQELFRVQGVDVGELDPDVMARKWGEIGFIGASVPPGSPFIGQTLRGLDFLNRFSAVVVGIRRNGFLIDGELAAQPLCEGDEIVGIVTPSLVKSWLPPEGLEVSRIDPDGIPDLRTQMFLLRIPAGSGLVGMTLRESRMGELVELTVAGIIRREKMLTALEPKSRIRAGDQLLVTGDVERIRSLLALGDVQLQQDISGAGIESDEVGIVEVTLAPRSRVAGKTLAEIDFRESHDLHVLSIWRRGRPLHGNLAHRALRLGDAFLVQGSWKRIRLLGTDPDFVVLAASAQEPRRTRKAPVALLGLLLMIGMVVTGFQPIQVAAFTAATFVVLFGAITMEEAYRAVEWKAVFLVAAILPVGMAMERTGASLFIADAIIAFAGPFGPHVAMTGLFSLSSLLSQCLDGAPAVVLMAPVVMQSAGQLGLGPHTAMMGVSLAASAAFMTPFSHKANLIVMGPGGYRVADYLRVGTPLTIIVIILMVWLVPVFIPIG